MNRFFLEAAQAPIVVEWDNKLLFIPKFTIDDIAAWGAQIMSQRIDFVTKDLDEHKRREYLRFYAPTPPSIGDLTFIVRSAVGARAILRAWPAGAKVFVPTPDGGKGGPLPSLTSDEIEQIIRVNGTGRC